MGSMDVYYLFHAIVESMSTDREYLLSVLPGTVTCAWSSRNMVGMYTKYEAQTSYCKQVLSNFTGHGISRPLLLSVFMHIPLLSAVDGRSLLYISTPARTQHPHELGTLKKNALADVIVSAVNYHKKHHCPSVTLL